MAEGEETATKAIKAVRYLPVPVTRKIGNSVGIVLTVLALAALVTILFYYFYRANQAETDDMLEMTEASDRTRKYVNLAGVGGLVVLIVGLSLSSTAFQKRVIAPKHNFYKKGIGAQIWKLWDDLKDQGRERRCSSDSDVPPTVGVQQTVKMVFKQLGFLDIAKDQFRCEEDFTIFDVLDWLAKDKSMRSAVAFSQLCKLAKNNFYGEASFVPFSARISPELGDQLYEQLNEMKNYSKKSISDCPAGLLEAKLKLRALINCFLDYAPNTRICESEKSATHNQKMGYTMDGRKTVLYCKQPTPLKDLYNQIYWNRNFSIDSLPIPNIFQIDFVLVPEVGGEKDSYVVKDFPSFPSSDDSFFTDALATLNNQFPSITAPIFTPDSPSSDDDTSTLSSSEYSTTEPEPESNPEPDSHAD